MVKWLLGSLVVVEVTKENGIQREINTFKNLLFGSTVIWERWCLHSSVFTDTDIHTEMIDSFLFLFLFFLRRDKQWPCVWTCWRVFPWLQEASQNMSSIMMELCPASRKPLKVHHENHPGIRDGLFIKVTMLTKYWTKVPQMRKYLSFCQILPKNLLQPLVSVKYYLGTL